MEKTKAIKQGTLTKQGAKVRSWKKRHCVIFGGGWNVVLSACACVSCALRTRAGCLLYYKSSSAALPQGGLSLVDCTVTFAEVR